MERMKGGGKEVSNYDRIHRHFERILLEKKTKKKEGSNNDEMQRHVEKKNMNNKKAGIMIGLKTNLKVKYRKKTGYRKKKKKKQ